MSVEQELKELKTEIETIKARNRRVEADKAWEKSKTRTAFIAGMTFILVFIFMKVSPGQEPLPSAVFAVVAYWISTESYGVLKKWWLGRKRVSRS